MSAYPPGARGTLHEEANLAPAVQGQASQGHRGRAAGSKAHQSLYRGWEWGGRKGKVKGPRGFG